MTIAEETASTETPEQAEFRAEVRSFLAANAKPRQGTSPWAVNVHTSEDEAKEAFEEGCRWQRTSGARVPTELLRLTTKEMTIGGRRFSVLSSRFSGCGRGQRWRWARSAGWLR